MVRTSKDKSDLEKLVSATKESYQSPADVNAAGIAANVIEGRRNLLEGIVRAGDQMNAYPAVVDTPYLIWANPIDILIDSHLEPWNNRARVKGGREGSGNPRYERADSVGFFYFWDNTSTQNYVLVNVEATLVTKGFVTATGNTGFLSGGLATLSANASLMLYQGAAEPLLAGQTVSMYSVQAQGGGFWSRETGRLDTKGVFYGAALEYKYFPVPPASRVIFEVRLTLGTRIEIGSGSTSFEFASTAQDNYVQCPALVITILSGPIMATG